MGLLLLKIVHAVVGETTGNDSCALLHAFSDLCKSTNYRLTTSSTVCVDREGFGNQMLPSAFEYMCYSLVNVTSLKKYKNGKIVNISCLFI